MKPHRILSLLLSLSLCAGLLTVPAGAYHVEYRADGTPYFAAPFEDELWRREHSDEIMESFNRTGGPLMLPLEFHDGLTLFESLEDSLAPRYIDRDCNAYDLGRGRYWLMCSFSEGLAAAVTYDTTEADAHPDVQICYIDKQGNEVFRLDPSFCALKHLSSYFVGYFQNGRACVIRNPRHDLHQDGILADYYYYDYGVEYAYIDTTGKVVTDWTLLTDMEDIVQLPLYEEYGTWIGHVMTDKFLDRNPPLFADGDKAVTPPLAAEHPGATYGQAEARFVGYTIDPENLYSGRGDLVILLTNNTPNWDEGDLFHLMYCLFSEDVLDGVWDLVDSATEFLPYGNINQIHYEIEPWGVKYLYVPTPYVINEAGKMLWRGFEDMGPHWMEISKIGDSRTVFLQAETPVERDQLVEFLKRANDYPEMQLTYEPHNGVTLLGASMSRLSRKAYLDQVLAPFTSQF